MIASKVTANESVRCCKNILYAGPILAWNILTHFRTRLK